MINSQTKQATAKPRNVLIKLIIEGAYVKSYWS
nr:MAG TPA: hypothetical protein [Bacteriophage sp.]